MQITSDASHDNGTIAVSSEVSWGSRTGLPRSISHAKSASYFLRTEITRSRNDASLFCTIGLTAAASAATLLLFDQSGLPNLLQVNSVSFAAVPSMFRPVVEALTAGAALASAFAFRALVKAKRELRDSTENLNRLYSATKRVRDGFLSTLGHRPRLSAAHHLRPDLEAFKWKAESSKWSAVIFGYFTAVTYYLINNPQAVVSPAPDSVFNSPYALALKWSGLILLTAITVKKVIDWASFSRASRKSIAIPQGVMAN